MSKRLPLFCPCNRDDLVGVLPDLVEESERLFPLFFNAALDNLQGDMKIRHSPPSQFGNAVQDYDRNSMRTWLMHNGYQANANFAIHPMVESPVNIRYARQLAQIIFDSYELRHGYNNRPIDAHVWNMGRSYSLSFAGPTTDNSATGICISHCPSPTQAYSLVVEPDTDRIYEPVEPESVLPLNERQQKLLATHGIYAVIHRQMIDVLDSMERFTETLVSR